MTVPGTDGCDQLVKGGGSATWLMHKGKELEEQYAKDKSVPDPASTDNLELKCILRLLNIVPQEQSDLGRVLRWRRAIFWRASHPCIALDGETHLRQQ